MTSKNDKHQAQVEKAVTGVTLPPSFRIRAWTEGDFLKIQQLSTEEGWPTPEKRPNDTLTAWRNSWPTLVLEYKQEVIGFLRALTDELVTTYIAEILIASEWRGQGFGQALIEVCHQLHSPARLDLLSTESADDFYEARGFRQFRGFRKSFQ